MNLHVRHFNGCFAVGFPGGGGGAAREDRCRNAAEYVIGQGWSRNGPWLEVTEEVETPETCETIMQEKTDVHDV